jgi:hypothetical protein
VLFNEDLLESWAASTAFAAGLLFSDSLLVPLPARPGKVLPRTNGRQMPAIAESGVFERRDLERRESRLNNLFAMTPRAVINPFSQRHSLEGS